MKKAISKIIIFILIIIIISLLFISDSFATYNMSDLAGESYSSIMNISPSTLITGDYTYPSGGDSVRFSRANYLCLEKSNHGSLTNFKAYLVIDINPNGNNIDYAEYYYRTTSGTCSSKQTVEDYRIAELAYISYVAYCAGNCGQDAANNYNYAFSYVWRSYSSGKNAKSLFTSSFVPDDYRSTNSVSYNTAAESYRTNGYITENGTQKTITARIIVFHADSYQDTAMLYGTTVDNASAEINKYITSSSDSYVSIGNRSGMSNGSNGEKHASPVKVAPGDTVTYTIVISNSGSSAISVNLEDSFASCLSYVSSTASFTWSRSGNKLTASGVSIPASGMTFTVTLQVSSSTSIADTKYKNEIKLTYNNTTSTADDYIIVNPEISIDKYVTSVSDVTSVANSNSGTTSYGTTSTSYGTTRAGKSVESKKSDPVKLRTWSGDNL